MLLDAMLKSPVSAAREMDRLFESLMSSQPVGFIPSIRSQWAYPAINVWEAGESFHAEAELPGMTMDQIEVLVTEDQLTIQGKRDVNVPENARPLRRERLVGSFERSVALPAPIDTEKVEAKFVNGVLTIALPKAEAYRPRRILVQTPKQLTTS